MQTIRHYQLDDETFDKTIRRPWHVPGAHSIDGQDFPADDYEAALATSEPIATDLGDLREGDRSVEGGALFAVLLVLAILAVVGVVWWLGMNGKLL